jgi:iron complex outermembrane receptor protein
LEVDWTGRQALHDDPYLTSSESYVVAGVLASQTVGKFKVYLSVQNVTGVQQTDYAPIVLPARGPGGRWTTDQWAPLAGRIVNGGVRLQF